MRIYGVTQLKPIRLGDGSFVYPLSYRTRLELDKKRPSKSKRHQLIYQQQSCYGTVGDCCTTLNNQELLELEKKGLIKIHKSRENR